MMLYDYFIYTTSSWFDFKHQTHTNLFKENKFNELSIADLRMPESMLPRNWNLLNFQQSCQGNTGNSPKSCLGPRHCWRVQQNIPVFDIRWWKDEASVFWATKNLSKVNFWVIECEFWWKCVALSWHFPHQGTRIFNINFHVSRPWEFLNYHK